jgi:hypothetical protein
VAGRSRLRAGIYRWHEGWLPVIRDVSCIGAVGVLTIATRGSGGPGEVLIKIRGGSEAFIAWSEQPLPKGATVLVIDSRGARTVDVMEWDDPLGDFPGGFPGGRPPGLAEPDTNS